MRISAFAVPAVVACGFFLYVLIQLVRDEKRPRKGAGGAGRLTNFPSGKARPPVRESGGEPMRYVELTLPAELIVTPPSRASKKNPEQRRDARHSRGDA